MEKIFSISVIKSLPLCVKIIPAIYFYSIIVAPQIEKGDSPMPIKIDYAMSNPRSSVYLWATL
jgi:hypothetical protein